MRSARLAKAISKGKVFVRTGRAVTGSVFLKFRDPSIKDRIIQPYALKDQQKKSSFIHLSKVYSADQLLNSTLEDLLIQGDLELGEFK